MFSTKFPTTLLTLLVVAGLIVLASASQASDLANPKIAFTSNRDGNLEIYVMNQDGGPKHPNLMNAFAPQGEEGKWTKKADMPTARNAFATSTVKGKIYAIGGAKWVAGVRQLVSAVEEYDPVTDTWTKKADMPTARNGLSTSVVNGKIYAIGGGVQEVEVEEYDPATDTWTKKTDMPTPRSFFATSAVKGKIYAIGGWWPGPEEYDPVADTWTKKANMPTARYFLGTSVVNGKIYAIGGTQNEVVALSTVEEYDPVKDTWTKKADMPIAKAGFAISEVNGKIYVIGGGINALNVFNPPTVEEYDPATDTWTRKKADMPTRRWVPSASAVNGFIYVLGGISGNSSLSTVEAYDTGFREGIEATGKLPTSWGKIKSN